MTFLPLEDSQLDYIARTIGQRPYTECAGVMQLISVVANDKPFQAKLLAAVAGPLDTSAQAASNAVSNANAQAQNVTTLQAALDTANAQLEAARAAQQVAMDEGEKARREIQEKLDITTKNLDVAEATIRTLKPAETATKE